MGFRAAARDPPSRTARDDVETIGRPADVLVCATGFKLMTPGDALPYPVVGRHGIELGAFWDEHRYQSYQGVSVPGFPLPVTNEIGAFLIKDIFLLGAALWSAAESLRAVRLRSPAP